MNARTNDEHTGRRSWYHRAPPRNSARLRRAPPTHARHARDQQQGPLICLVPRLARTPPAHRAPARLGPLSPAQRRDRLRATQQRQRGCMLQPRGGAGRALAEIPRRVDAGASPPLFLLPPKEPLYLSPERKVKRERETRAMQMVSGTPWETVTLTTLSRDRALFAPLLAEARDAAMRGQEGRLVVHTAWGAEWRPFGLPRRRRPLHSVVLARGVAERIVEDVRSFLARREWYADRGTSLPSSLTQGTEGWWQKGFPTAEGIYCTDRLDRASRRSSRRSRAPYRTIYAC